MKRYFNAIVGLFYFLKNVQVFDTKFIDNKRVAIVGPADSALNSGMGKTIENYDIVVRINKSILVIDDAKYTKDIGSKTDILFHSFYENDFSGGGKLNVDLFDRHGVQFVVNPRFSIEGLRTVYNFYKRYRVNRPMYVLPRKLYKRITEPFLPLRPTTGFYALMTVLNSSFEELYVTGFTFFRTAYVKGYRDEMRTSSAAKSHIKSAKLHDPDLEFSEFRKFIQSQNHRRIDFDETLKSLLANT